MAQFVEGGAAAVEKNVPEQRGCDATSAAVEQPSPQGGFEIGNHLRYGRLGNAELHRGLGDASQLNHGREGMQVVQTYAATDPRIPIERLVGCSGHQQS